MVDFDDFCECIECLCVVFWDLMWIDFCVVMIFEEMSVVEFK